MLELQPAADEGLAFDKPRGEGGHVAPPFFATARAPGEVVPRYQEGRGQETREQLDTRGKCQQPAGKEEIGEAFPSAVEAQSPAADGLRPEKGGAGLEAALHGTAPKARGKCAAMADVMVIFIQNQE